MNAYTVQVPKGSSYESIEKPFNMLFYMIEAYSILLKGCEYCDNLGARYERSYGI